jgi:hypothetical protein
MMYQSKMAFAIKSNGKVLREFKDTVYIPFGTEYSILLKNLHTTRAVVNVFIDGVNQTPGGLVVEKEAELERSLLNGSLTTGNKFKFIERTGAVEEHRGVQLEDGLVKIEYQFESIAQIRTPSVFQNVGQDHYYNGLKVGSGYNSLDVPGHWLSASGSQVNAYNASLATDATNASLTTNNTGVSGVYNVGGIARGADMSRGEFTGTVASAAVNQYLKDNNIKPKFSGEVHDGCATMDMGYNDAGITVSGSRSNQRFSTTHMGAMDSEKFSMVIRLLGETPDNKPVIKSVTVKTKPKCVTCGRQNKATAKFCVECGTALEIFA